jgi:hypothetical protein
MMEHRTFLSWFLVLLITEAHGLKNGFQGAVGLPGDREASGATTVIGHGLEGLGDSGGLHEAGVLAVLAGLPLGILAGDGVGFVHGFALGEVESD